MWNQSNFTFFNLLWLCCQSHIRLYKLRFELWLLVYLLAANSQTLHRCVSAVRRVGTREPSQRQRKDGAAEELRHSSSSLTFSRQIRNEITCHVSGITRLCHIFKSLPCFVSRFITSRGCQLRGDAKTSNVMKSNLSLPLRADQRCSIFYMMIHKKHHLRPSDVRSGACTLPRGRRSGPRRAPHRDRAPKSTQTFKRPVKMRKTIRTPWSRPVWYLAQMVVLMRFWDAPAIPK